MQKRYIADWFSSENQSAFLCESAILQEVLLIGTSSAFFENDISNKNILFRDMISLDDPVNLHEAGKN